ncbi:MAG: chemotaxis protein CheA, partial [Pseudomonadota bacterium]
MSVEISQFFQVFFDEAEELLAEKERLLLRLDPAAFDMADIDAIFRVAHSIKGGAATFGLADMTGVTHVLESLLDRLRKGEMALTAEQVDCFLQAKDVLQMLLRGHRDGAEVEQPEVDALLARLNALAQPSANSPASNAAATAVPAGTSMPALRTVRISLPETSDKDAVALADELGLLGKVTVVDDDGRKVFLLETSESRDDITALCAFIVDPAKLSVTEECQPPYEIFHLPVTAPVRAEAAKGGADKAATGSTAGPASNAGVESSSIRVSVDKVDQLINLVGELVITQAMIEQRTHGLDPMLHEKLLNCVSQLTRNTRHLQEAVMSIRMMPMDYVFSRFPRMVRDLAAKLGKRVDFVTQGVATELDKGLIERIIDPLTHLVRNSVDHGIELPAVRQSSGKDATGRLTLSAMHRGGHVVIEVSDDGGGLKRERILAKARQQGLPVSDNMSDGEVWQLIFAPGFSTAETVTDVSGRGVGMDVVKRNITALGGQVDIRSVAGVGTTVSIALPLTLAIL